MVGQVPVVALADEIEAGHVRALVITGGNPIGAVPEPDRLRAALASLDVLAVVDVVESELTDLATHVLPATGQLERADLNLAANLSVRSGVQCDRRRSSSPLPTAGRCGGCSARWPDGWAATSSAGPTRTASPTSRYLRGLLAHSPLDADEVVAAGPRGLDVDPEHGWVHETMLPGGRWQIAPRGAGRAVVRPRRARPASGWS